MTISLLEHLEGCTPLLPCASCKAAAYLRGKLGDEGFEEYASYVRILFTPAEDPVSGVTNPLPLGASLTELWLSKRPHRVLWNKGCRTIADVVKYSPEDCLRIPNFGETSLHELIKALAESGHRLSART